MDRSEILKRLKADLESENFPDYCVNGLQVEGTVDIQKIIVSVSASQALFDEAVKRKANMIIVHHGLFWKNTPHPFHLTGVMYRRVKTLIDRDINLVAFHLPLDAHPELGNNAQILKALDARIEIPMDVGFRGFFPEPLSPAALKAKLEQILPNPPVHYDYGPDTIRSLVVISGGASTMIEKVADQQVDAFISGDQMESVPRLAQELNLHFFSCGHYNTERFGPMALAQHIRDTFQIDCEFIDIPNPA